MCFVAKPVMVTRSEGRTRWPDTFRGLFATSRSGGVPATGAPLARSASAATEMATTRLTLLPVCQTPHAAAHRVVTRAIQALSRKDPPLAPGLDPDLGGGGRGEAIPWRRRLLRGG